MNGNEDGNKINRSNAAINVLPQRGEGGHTRDIDIEASPVTGAAELLLTQSSPGVGPFWHFQKRRTGRKYSPERSKMAGVSKSGANGDKEGKILLNTPENMPVASFWFVSQMK